ncbi:MAG: hypothetical protein KGL31_11120 [candidate division NC10 bacterium]|nr:hypothetical protein [candidate division NC10 bacterium]MDE2322443.1 hypothetical protein [candidate division NC10 bacterium]
MGRKCGVDRGLFQRGGAWWICWTRLSRHDDQEKIDPAKFPAKAFYRKRKLAVKEEAHLRAWWNGSQNAAATPPPRW